MPLYECSQCHAVENTAMANFWWSQSEGTPPLCSECDTEIGKWHGKFPKLTKDEYLRQYPQGRIEYPFTPSANGSTDTASKGKPKP